MNFSIRSAIAELRNAARTFNLLVPGMPESEEGGKGEVLSTFPLLNLQLIDGILRPDAIGTTWPNWELVASLANRNADMFAGSATVSSGDSAISLVRPDSVPTLRNSADWTVDHIKACVIQALEACEELHSQAVTQDAGFSCFQMLNIVLRIELLIHEEMPLPTAVKSLVGGGGEAEEDGTVGWNLKPVLSSFVADEQMILLKSLRRLLCVYIAAVNSTDAREGGGTIEAITIGAFLVHIDAVARIFAFDESLYLSAALVNFGIPMDERIFGLEFSSRIIASPHVRCSREELKRYTSLINSNEIPFVDPRLKDFWKSFRDPWFLHSPAEGTLVFNSSNLNALEFVNNYLEISKLNKVTPKNIESTVSIPDRCKTFLLAGWLSSSVQENLNCDFVEYRDACFAAFAGWRPPNGLRNKKNIRQAADFYPKFAVVTYAACNDNNNKDISGVIVSIATLNTWTREKDQSTEDREDYQLRGISYGVFDDHGLDPFLDKSLDEEIRRVTNESQPTILTSSTISASKRETIDPRNQDELLAYFGANNSNLSQTIANASSSNLFSEGKSKFQSLLSSIECDDQPNSFIDPQRTEEDCLLVDERDNPTFGDALSKQEARELSCLFTVPHLRMPLILSFLAARPGALLQPALRHVITHLLFEPLSSSKSQFSTAHPPTPLPNEERAGVIIAGFEVALGPLSVIPVHPSDRDQVFSCGEGLLEKELCNAPGSVIEPFLSIFRELHSRANSLSPDPRSPHAAAFLWAIRVSNGLGAAIAAVLNRANIAFGFDESKLTDDQDLFLDSPTKVMMKLVKYRNEFISFLKGDVLRLVLSYLVVTEKSRDVTVSAVLHAHVLLIWEHTSSIDKGSFEVFDGESLPLSSIINFGYTQMLCSSMYIALWQRSARLQADEQVKAEYMRRKEADEGSSDNMRLSPFLTDNSLSPAMTSVICDILTSAPWHEACRIALKARPEIMAWLCDLERIDVVTSTTDFSPIRSLAASDVVLSQCVRVSLQRPKLEGMQWNWVDGSSREKNLCRLVLESPNPYPHGVKYFKRIHFPGTTNITISFAFNSSLESNDDHEHDYIVIYKDDSLE